MLASGMACTVAERPPRGHHLPPEVLQADDDGDAGGDDAAQAHAPNQLIPFCIFPIDIVHTARQDDATVCTQSITRMQHDD
jgi:hypothetical protein